MPDLIARPLWREFSARTLGRAARHARAGGIAVVKTRTWHLLGDGGGPGDALPLFTDWAIRAVEASRWAEVRVGPARGLAKASISRAWRARVGQWIARDSAFSGAVANARFDCRRCAACCHDNRVVLDEEDLARLRAAKRPELIANLSRRGGVRSLPLIASTHACAHLGTPGEPLACAIYRHRPNMCREFPAGTEQCLTSREDLYGSPFPAGR